MKKQYLMQFAVALLLAVAMIIIADVAVGTAQPGLPSSPDQAPIDGGLGILAALGGGYALKKLRDKKR